MALVLADRVRETSTTTGTVAVVLAGAYPSFQSFSATVGNGNTTYYAISNLAAGEWEVGIGTYTSSGNTLSRDTVLSSSNAGNLVNFLAGTKDVICTQPSERAVYVEGTNIVANNAATLPITTVGGLGTGVATALAVNVGTAGAPVVNGGVLGTPSSGTVTNLTGTASININGTVGATTPAAGAFTTLSATGVTTVQAGSAAAPAITTSGDTNTGIFFPAADNVAATVAGVEGMRLTSTGLGIGTSSPSSPLTITKSSATAIEIPSGATYPVNAYGATTGSTQIAIANTGGTSYFGNESSGAGTTFSGTAAYATLLGTSAARSLQFVTNNTVRATLDSSGNLGIGTSSPTTAGGRAIHIANSSGDSRLHLTDNTTGATADDGTEIVVNSGNLYIDQKESQPIIILTGSTERMRIDSSGNVGIGTSSPESKLTITNNVTEAIPLVIKGGNPSLSPLPQFTGLAFGYGSAANYQKAGILFEFTAADGRGNLHFATDFTATNSNVDLADARMTITGAGDVGIGTKTPDANLTVNGAASFAAGTAAAPSIARAGDLNTGIFFPAADTIAFAEGGVEAMRINSAGDVGIGTSSPGVKLDVIGAIRSLVSGGVPQIYFNDGTSQTNINGDGSAFKFVQSGSETMRIDSSGRVGIGFNIPNAQFVVQGAGGGSWVNGSRNTLQLRNSNASSNQSNFISFGSSGNESYCFIGNDINADGTTVNQLNVKAGATGGAFLANGGTSWSAVSDERQKDIIEPITDAMAKVATLRTVIGKYKIDNADKRRVFLIAQDVQAVLPEAVTIGSDENNTLGLSYSDIIPLLVASIKEQQALITALTTRITALEQA